MKRLCIFTFAAACLGLGVFLLPALSQTAGKLPPAKKPEDPTLKALRANFEKLLKRERELHAELIKKDDEIGKLRDEHEKQNNILERKIRVLELNLREHASAKGEIKKEDERPPILAKEFFSAKDIMRLLDQPIDTKGLTEKIKLKVALEYIADKSGGKLPILIDREAFADPSGKDDPDPYEEEVALPAVPTMMRMETVLRLLVSQIGNGQATFVIHNTWIEITTGEASKAAHLLPHPSIITSFEKRPVPEVLQELAKRADIAIHIDPNIGDRARTPITATFRNCSLEEALVVVTEMAKLKYVVLDRSIYVTTPEQARNVEKDEKARTEKKKLAPPRRARRLESAA